MTPTRTIRLSAAPVAAAVFLLLWIIAEAGRMRFDPLAPRFAVVTWLVVIAVVAAAIGISTALPRVAVALCLAIVIAQVILPVARFTANSWPVYFGFALVAVGMTLRATGRLGLIARWGRLQVRRIVARVSRLRVVSVELPGDGPTIDGLSAREREIFLLAARGLSNSEIAREAFISEATAKSHIAHILAKLGMPSRAQLVAFAWERGLVSSSR